MSLPAPPPPPPPGPGSRPAHVPAPPPTALPVAVPVRTAPAVPTASTSPAVPAPAVPAPPGAPALAPTGRPRLRLPRPHLPRPTVAGTEAVLRRAGTGLRQARTRAAKGVTLLRRRAEQLRDRLVEVPLLGRAMVVLASFVTAVTPLGWWSVVALVTAWWLAATRHWLEAWTLTVALAVLLVVAVIWSLGRTTYVVAVSLVSSRVTVGEPALGNVTLTNPASRAASSAVVEMPVGAGLAAFHVPRLASGEVHEEVFTIPTRRRGLVTVGPVTSVRGDALGLLRRTQRWTDPLDLYIHPRTVTLDSNAIGFIRDIEGAVTQDLSSSDVSFHALRDYVPGDDRRNVHWKTTARTGRLMVRQFEETRRAHLLLVLDLDPGAWPDPEDFETAVAVTGSLALATMREYREVSLVSQAGIPLLPTPTRALDILTTVEPLPDCDDLVEITRHAAAAVPQASVTVLLTGPATAAHTIHRAHAELPLGTRPLAVQVDRQAPLTSHQVAGLPVLTLPVLDQLPLAMRKVGS